MKKQVSQQRVAADFATKVILREGNFPPSNSLRLNITEHHATNPIAPVQSL